MKRRPRLRPQLNVLHLEDRIVPTRLLPDLTPDPANLAGWTVSTSNGITKLAYATGMQNIGQGAFELRGTTTIITNPDNSQSQIVNQRVYNSDGTWADQVAGAFVYHPNHGHVHYDNFAWGILRTRPTANWEDGAIVAIGPKTSFCLIDIQRNNPQLPGSPASAKYTSCGSQVQGISVGWKDVYSSNLEGQQIDITGLPNGDYWLEVHADPMNHVEELDETNNITRIPISLTTQPPVGLRVQTSTPVGAQDGPVSGVTLGFNMDVIPASFTTDDVSFTGPGGAIAISSITATSPTSFTINFASQTQVGTYTMVVGPDILSATDGKPMNQDNDSNYGEPIDDAYTNIFTITAPRVTASTPSGAVSTPVSSIRITYNKPIDVASFTFADIVSFTGPGGGDLMGQISGIVPLTSPGSAAFDINFATMSGNGTYTLVLEPHVTDMLGNLVDQNGDFITDANDRFTASFTIVPAGTIGPDAFGYTAVAATFEDLSSVSTWSEIILSGDDVFASVNFGTNSFNFYGTKYTGTDAANTLHINSNGLLSFAQSSKSYTNNDLSSISYNSVTIHPAAIAPLWDDWKKGSGTPQVRGTFQDLNGDTIPDRYVIEWNQMYHYNMSSGGVTFQAVLELNTGDTPGDITLIYPDLDTGNAAYSNGASASVGIRAAGTTAPKLLVSQNSGSNALINSGKAVKLSVPKVQSITRVDGPTIPAGNAEFLVTFSEGIAQLSEDDFAVESTGNIAWTLVDHVHHTPDPRVWEVHVKTGPGNGTLKLNLIDTDSIQSILGAKLGGVGTGNGSFFKGESYTVVQPPPQVLGINIGDGTAQRSMVKQVQIAFDWPVNFAGSPADAFSVTGPGGTVNLAVDLSGSSPFQTIAKLTFSGPGTTAGSLHDGTYTLTVLGNQINTGGVNLDGDANGSPGGNFTAAFKRLFGDSNGDGTVDSSDFATFGTAFGTSAAGNPFDYNGDSSIDASDFAEFGNRFGLSM